jgi:dynein light chain roadblock-type
MSTENNIEELIKQVTLHQGVQGFIIVNNEGIPIRHSFADTSRLLAIQYSALLQNLAQKAKAAIHELEPTNDLVFMRLRSKKHEILVAPESKYLLIVIQQPVVS